MVQVFASNKKHTNIKKTTTTMHEIVLQKLKLKEKNH